MKAEQKTVTDDEWSLFRRLVEERSGIHLPPTRRTHLERAVSDVLTTGAFEDAYSLYRHLSSERGHTELEDFVASLTVGETHFFRNKPQIEALERHVLPDLIRRRSAEKRLRVWSAGCSTGEEPYSVAMLLDRILPRRTDWNITILATDIDRDALKKAREGIYRPWSFRGVSRGSWSRYFLSRSEEGVELVPRIRDMVRFEYLNLVEDAYPSLSTDTNAMDLVICRNVLIYFRDETARAVVERLQRAMVEDAWLFLGHSEPSDWVAGLSVHNFPGTIAYHGSRTKAALKPHLVTPPPRARARERRAAPRISKDRRRARSAPHAMPSDQNGGPAPLDRCDAALGALASGDVRGALVQLEAMAKAHPDDPRPPYLIAKVYAGAIEVEPAEMWTRVALERDRLFAPAHHLQGLIAAEDGRLEDAAAALRRCVYAAPDWALGYFALADVLLRTGQRIKARAALQNVQRLLADVPPEQDVPEGDGLTAGRLRELAEMQQHISGLRLEARRR